MDKRWIVVASKSNDDFERFIDVVKRAIPHSQGRQGHPLPAPRRSEVVRLAIPDEAPSFRIYGPEDVVSRYCTAWLKVGEGRKLRELGF